MREISVTYPVSTVFIWLKEFEFRHCGIYWCRVTASASFRPPPVLYGWLKLLSFPLLWHLSAFRTISYYPTPDSNTWLARLSSLDLGHPGFKVPVSVSQWPQRQNVSLVCLIADICQLIQKYRRHKKYLNRKRYGQQLSVTYVVIDTKLLKGLAAKWKIDLLKRGEERGIE